MIYRHEQIGRSYIVLLGFMAVLCLVVAFYTRSTSFAFVLCALLLGACISFARLTIEVDSDALRWSMTFGIPGGTIPIGEIVSAEVVPVSVWYGIGIHLTLRGWVWNVTDAPEALLAAIDRVRSR